MRSRKISFFVMVLVFLAVSPSPVLAGLSDYIKSVTFTAENEQDDIPAFEQEIIKDGVAYTLSDVQTETVNKIPVEEKRYFTKIVETVVPKGEEFVPLQEIMENGVTYTCTEVKKEEANGLGITEQIVSGYTDYTYPVNENDVPKTKTIAAVNQATGKTEDVVCELSGVTQNGGGWQSNHIDITFYNVNAERYEWNGIIVSNQDNPLSGYENELLQSVGADSSSRITDIYWVTEPYEDEQGLLCRDARADVEQYVNYYRASYEAKLSTETKGIRYRAVYEGIQKIESDTDFKYERKAVATYEKTQKNSAVKYVVAGIGIVVLIVLLILILYSISKKRKRKE